MGRMATTTTTSLNLAMLPLELRRKILLFLDSLDDLKAAIQTSHGIFDAYDLGAEDAQTSVLFNNRLAAALFDSHRLVNQNITKEEHAGILEAHNCQPSPQPRNFFRPSNINSRQAPPEDDEGLLPHLPVSRLLEDWKVVCSLADAFCQQIDKPSRTEIQRVRDAVYRYWLVRNVFFVPKSHINAHTLSEDAEWLFLSEDQLWKYLSSSSLFGYWEIQSMLVIRNYIIESMTDLLARKHDFKDIYRDTARKLAVDFVAAMDLPDIVRLLGIEMRKDEEAMRSFQWKSMPGVTYAGSGLDRVYQDNFSVPPETESKRIRRRSSPLWQIRDFGSLVSWATKKPSDHGMVWEACMWDEERLQGWGFEFPSDEQLKIPQSH